MARKLRLFKSVNFYSARWKGGGSRALGVDDVESVKDMLRYDVAFMSDAYPGVVACVKYNTRGAGTHAGKPKMERWDSFSVWLVPFASNDPAVAAARATFTVVSETWFTYRHPRRSGGPTDYAALERVTLAQFFGEEDLGGNWA